MQLRPFFLPVAVAAFVVPAVLLNTAKAIAEDIRFTLVNDTSVNMTEFYAAPSGVDNWENDILGEDVLPAKRRVLINLNDDRRDCDYDFRARFADGEVVEKFGINVCKLAGNTYTFYEE